MKTLTMPVLTPSEAAFVLEVLQVVGDAGMHDSLFWRTDEDYGPITFWINANDLFYWATADGEKITPENVSVLRQAIADCVEIDPSLGTCWAPDLFCSRARGMRPQRPCWKRYPENILPLFMAAGPERDPKTEG